jgi:hypothetical protein
MVSVQRVVGIVAIVLVLVALVIGGATAQPGSGRPSGQVTGVNTTLEPVPVAVQGDDRPGADLD